MGLRSPAVTAVTPTARVRAYRHPRVSATAQRLRVGSITEACPASWPSIRLGAVLLAFALAAPVAAQEPEIPIDPDEHLTYTIAWPSGLPVGTAEFRSRFVDPGWRFELALRASLPEIEIDDAFRSVTGASLCSVQFEKHLSHGSKRAHELLRFSPESVDRTNLASDRSERPGRSPVSGCAFDALAFLYHLRRDLSDGRISPPGTVYFGAAYRVDLEYAQTRRLVWDTERRVADEIRVTVRGPDSEHGLSVYFGRDHARTPLLFRVELEGKPYTMQLVE